MENWIVDKNMSVDLNKSILTERNQTIPVGQNKNTPVGQNKNTPVGQNKNTPVGQASRLSNDSWHRHLPHFQLSSGYYFITFTTHNRQLLQPAHKDCVFNAICYLDGKKYELFAVVVLNDHVHLIINPKDPMSKITHSIKSFTAHQINKMLNSNRKVWQDESFDRVIRN